MLLDWVRLWLTCSAEGYRPAGGDGPHRSEETLLYLSVEPLRDGVVIEVERPGSELDARSVIV
jgi:hypothetical protein